MAEPGFAEQVRAARAELGLSQQELADRAGVSRGTIRNTETGTIPTPATRRAILHALRPRPTPAVPGAALDVEATFAALLAQTLGERGTSQRELAARARGLGVQVHESAISKVLTPAGQRRAVRLCEAVAFACVLGLDLQQLVPAYQCTTCGDGPPSGYTCNTCGRTQR